MRAAPLRGRLLGEPLLEMEVDVGERGGAGDRVAAEGREVVADLEGVGDLGAGGEGAERQAVGDALGHAVMMSGSTP